MSEYKALVVDFGGVLTTPLQDSMIAFANEVGIELQDLARAALGAYTGEQDDLVMRFETGDIPQEEFAEAFAARLTEVTGVQISSERLVQRLFGTLQLVEEMLDAVASAGRAGFKTGLLSNSWGVGGYPRKRLDPLFDEVVISGEVGMRKPDRAIFELMTDKLGVAAADCVFVDDHPGHLKAANELGMKTVLHKDPADTIAELQTLLNLPV